MVKRPLLFIILLGIASMAMGQQSWEGLATVSRFGQFPAGLYGASNLVSPNSLVSVRNLETGLAERIIITVGVDEPGVFLVLSPEAAALLGVSGSGATRVRLTTIVTDTMPADTASEQPFHRDPDINPAAGVTGFPELPPTVDESVQVASAEESPVEESAEAETSPDTSEEPENLPSDEPADGVLPDDPEESVDEPVEVVAEPEREPESIQPDEVTEIASGLRGGIAAGVARTRVGQAQESFERPDTALEVERPDTMDETVTEVGEPELEPEEVATAGLTTLEPEPETVPTVETQPVVRADDSGSEPLDESVDEPIEAEPDATAPTAAPDEAELADSPVRANPIQDAIAAAVNRIPARDFFPPPVGEESDLGFSGLSRPAENDRLNVALDEAEVPAVDRPELAGLGPLQAVPPVLPSTLAQAAVPREDLPEFAAFGNPTPPSRDVDTPVLPVALLGAEDRPVIDEPERYSAPGVALVPIELAEATVAPEERPDIADIGSASAPEARDVDATLAQAEIAGEELPELADIGPADAPSGFALDPSLAEATVAPEERPDIADIGSASAPEARDVDATLAQAEIAGEELPELADIGPAAAPSGFALDPTLAEAGVRAPESPDSDGVRMVGAPAELLEAELVEATLTDAELPELADVGPADVPLVAQISALLPEAEPAAAEVPEDSLAGFDPGPEGDVPTLALEPDPGSLEVASADGSIEVPADAPTDVLLTLEPADFRPPEVPNPDDALIDRESPVEDPEVVVALEAPIAEEPADEPAEEPVIEVAVVSEPITEPIEVAVAQPVRVESAAADLPVVSELIDENYYLQIGAYTVPATAQVAVDALAATYPMAVMPVDSRGTTVYRVLVGPLEEDETGTLLMWLRAKGYRDTFVRSGTEL